MYKMINTPVIFKAEKVFEWRLAAQMPLPRRQNWLCNRLLRRAINQKLVDNPPLRPLAQG